MFKTPLFWNRKSWLSYLLWPLSWVWAKVGEWKQKSVSCQKVSVPVICVGNLVMGGAGKTPTVIALTEILKELGFNPHILSRGYGAHVKDVIRVDPKKGNYLKVGDEPLLLSEFAPTWVGANRVKSAQAAIEAGASILIMDDGLQNNSLYKDLSFCVIDEKQGIGNGFVFPSGPLREPILNGLKKAQALIIVGSHDPLKDTIHQRFFAQLKCLENGENKPYVAFAGIGFPEKFKATLLENDYHICEFLTYADHQPYTVLDIMHIIKIAKEHHANIITTAKDFLRIPASYRENIKILPVTLQFKEKENLKKFIKNYFNIEDKI